MADAFPLDFTALRSQMVLGPEHHQFQLIKPVSNSPIGQVWHAYDLSTASDEKDADKVALEFVNPVLLKDRALETFKRQVTLCKQLDNQHIAKTYGYFMSREGWLFVAMEPVATRSLARILLEDGYQQLSIKKIRIILSQVAKALDYAHSKRISHGDLTPWNIIITPGSGAKLVNFAFRQPLLQQIQKQGMRILNTEFHAPEAFDHLPLPNSVDIYSFGCLAYQLFDGRPPFSPEQPLDIRDTDHLDVPKQLTEEQWNILKPTLSENPADRPDSAMALVKALFPPNVTLEPATPSATSDREPAKKKAATATGRPSPATTRQLSVKAIAAGFGLFAAGLASGYLASNYSLQNQQSLLFAKLTTVQDILAQPASADNSQSLDQAFAELAMFAHQPALIAATQRQVDNYKTRLSALTSDLSRTKSVLVSEETPEPSGTVTAVAETANGFKSGSVFKDEIMTDVFGPNMIVIPSGRFRMGDQNRRGDDNELPVHEVTIKRPFALSQNEITFRDYDLFALNTGRALPNDGGWGRGNRPVINVSWNDANAYADWIRRQTGLSYRLPTEAEWEYAARAGTTTAFSWGNDKGRNKAACDDCNSEFDGQKTAPIGSFEANPFGLYDMHGNVYEWVSDCYNESYENAPDDGSSWNVGQCNYRVMRGGSWYDISRLIRSASRYRHPPDSSRNNWGFRLALDLDN